MSDVPDLSPAAEPRWLGPDATAAYIGVRVENLRRLVKAGKLPPPSYLLGPNQPRFDRLAIDKVFGGEDGSHEESMADAIQSAARSMRAEAASRRNGQVNRVKVKRAERMP